MGSIYTNADGLRQHFGTRVAGEEANFGDSGASGSYREISISIRGSDFISNVYIGPTLVLPAGVIVRESVAEVTEAFVMTGTSAVINVGVSGSESTNRLAQVTEAQAEAVGTYDTDATSAGTLAVGTPLAAQSTITIALGGTSPTVTAAGKLVLRVRVQDISPV
jgi:hypothetical protein